MFYINKKTLDDKAEESLPKSYAGIDWGGYFQSKAEQAVHPLLKAYYQAGMTAADTPIAEVPLMAMDFETTGLDPKKDEIISIGLVPMSIQRIQSKDSSYWLLKPQAELKDSVTIHGITDSVISEADDISTIIDDLLHVLKRHVVVVHYAYVERAFLNAALESRLGEGIEFPVIDTLQLEALINQPPPPTFWQRLTGHKPKKVPLRLGQSRERYHLPFYRPHHALTDALACAELFQAQIATHFTADTPLKKLWR